MTFLTRADWGARPPRQGPGPLDPLDVIGIALHWPAMAKPLRGDAVSAALRSWQDYHMDTRGWSDIAYQEAIDQDGNVYELRGLHTQSGANGDTDVNEEYGALLLVLAPGELPTPELMTATRARIARHRTLFPQSRRVVGHQQIRPEPTACPGPIVQKLIDADRFNPTGHEEDDMLSPEDIDKIAEACADKVRAELLMGQLDAPEGRRIGATLSSIYNRTRRIEAMLKGHTSGPDIETR